MIKICHMSSVHRGLDVRIFHKECVSLAQAGYETHLVIAASSMEVVKAAAKGVSLHPLPSSRSRLARIFTQAWRCYRLARKLNADVYHFHDPELIPYAVILTVQGKRVIYDVHEDLPRDILDKQWIPLWMRKAVAMAAEAVENIGARSFFHVVTATPLIAERFKRINGAAVNINNYPIADEFAPAIGSARRGCKVCYVGGVVRIRGLKAIVEALPLVPNSRLVVCGTFTEPEFEEELRAMPGWHQVDYLGQVDRSELKKVMIESIAGLVTFLPVPNHIHAQPNKIFEYMSAELPVIASNFPLWRQILEESEAGICVDPQSPQAIADAISRLMQNPNEVVRMGGAGRRAVLERYNWSVEAEKLVQLYEEIT